MAKFHYLAGFERGTSCSLGLNRKTDRQRHFGGRFFAIVFQWIAVKPAQAGGQSLTAVLEGEIYLYRPM